MTPSNPSEAAELRRRAEARVSEKQESQRSKTRIESAADNTQRLVQWHEKAVDPTEDRANVARFLLDEGRQLAVSAQQRAETVFRGPLDFGGRRFFYQFAARVGRDEVSSPSPTFCGLCRKARPPFSMLQDR